MGEVVITAAGVIIVGSVAIKAGSYLYNKVINWIQVYRFNSSAEKAVKNAGKDKNKVNHIMNPKHKWNKFFERPQWSYVAPVLIKVLKEGSETWERSNVYLKTLVFRGYVVQVRYIKEDGLVKFISTAWTK